jgi:uncharacterized protein (TIGR02145 family)
VKVKVTGPYLPSGTPSLESDELEIAVGGCPAKINTSPVTWLFFQCHNLGGEDITSPDQTIGREHHGDWYKFGATVASLENIQSTDTYNNSSEWSSKECFTTPGQDWPAANNPCPAGWRLPTNEEWKKVMGLTADNSSFSDNNSTTNSGNTISSVPSASWSADVFINFKKVGDYLFLPAAGYRSGSDGALGHRGSIGYYWSSTAASSNAWYLNVYCGGQYTYGTLRSYGLSVRCVAVE